MRLTYTNIFISSAFILLHLSKGAAFRFQFLNSEATKSNIPCSGIQNTNKNGKSASNTIIPAIIAALTFSSFSLEVFAKEPQLDIPSSDEFYLRTGKNAPKNPLTNPVLEKIRIVQQANDDISKYGGELASGDGSELQISGGKLLAPIVKISDTLKSLDSLLMDGPKGWEEAKAIVSAPPFTKIEFKKTFNAYSDNIYYSNPDRANVYLLGGAEPSSLQSLAYLYRNEALTNVEFLREELTYLLKESSLPDGDNDTVDLMDYYKKSLKNIDLYFGIVPPSDLSAARQIVNEK